MIREVIFIWLSIYMISVASNPIQVIPQPCPICPYSSPTTIQNYQPPSQNSPYPHPPTVQNETPTRDSSLDGLNQLLMNKIMSNQCLQKILDPNTKLFNQNGREIQRQPNTGTPNVVNNYFILPPEVFLQNDTKQKEDKPKRKRKNSTSLAKLRADAYSDDAIDAMLLTDKEPSRRLKNNNRGVKGDGKRKRSKLSGKSERLIEISEKDDKNDKERAVRAKSRKQHSGKPKNKNASTTLAPSFDESAGNRGDEKVHSISTKNRKKKRNQRKKSKTQSPELTQDITAKSIVGIPDEENNEYEIRKPKNNQELESDNCLKNIESPLDNLEVTKDLTENRLQARNSKHDIYRGQTFEPMRQVPDDILGSFYPYMNLNNYFNPNMNYPFDFGQLYQSLYGRNTVRSRRRKSKKKKNEQNNRDSLPNVVEVKVKPKKQTVVTENPTDTEYINEEIEEQSDFLNDEVNAEIIESVTDIPMEIPQEEYPIHESEEEIDNPEISEPEIIETKPIDDKIVDEVHFGEIEDLHEYITPELTREDILPTVYNNSIIKDYYPIFYDDGYYTSDENYELEDLDHDRFFYSTDRGEEESFNRDRRKYDSNYKIPNNIKDRINFRRRFLNKDSETRYMNYDENFEQHPKSNDFIVFKEEANPSVNSRTKEEFKMPPLLENPDFKSTQIDKSDRSVKLDSYAAPFYIPDKVSENPISSVFVRTNEPNLADVSSSGLKTDHHDYVETVFAKTRVVKYGGADKLENNAANNDKDEFPSDGHTTYVVAKSMGPVEDFYWR